MARAREGRGRTGVKKGSRLDKDLQARSDVAKRDKRARQTVAKVAAGKSRTTKKTMPRSNAEGLIKRGTSQRITILEHKVAKARSEAKRVARAGNKTAAATWQKVAQTRMAQLKKLRGK